MLTLFWMTELITLTTSWGFHDFYGNLLQHKLEDEFQVKTVVLSHSIPKYNNYEAAWQVKNAVNFLLKPALHVIDTGSVYDENQTRLLVKNNDQLYLCKNNGTISLLGLNNKEVFEIDGRSGNAITSLIQQVNRVLSNEAGLNLANRIKETLLPAAKNETHAITGIILYKDAQGHLHTNITKEEIIKKGWDLDKINIQTQKIGQIPFLLNKPKDQQLKSNDAILGYNFEEKLYIFFEQGDGASILGINQGDYVKITHNLI